MNVKKLQQQIEGEINLLKCDNDVSDLLDMIEQLKESCYAEGYDDGFSDGRTEPVEKDFEGRDDPLDS